MRGEGVDVRRPRDSAARIVACSNSVPGLTPRNDELVVVEQRPRGPDAGELALGSVDVQQVRDPHPVQGAVADARGDVEVGVEVEVAEPEALHPVAQPRDGAELDRAIATEREQRAVRAATSEATCRARSATAPGSRRRVSRVGRPPETPPRRRRRRPRPRGRQRVAPPRLAHRPRPLPAPARTRPRWSELPRSSPGYNRRSLVILTRHRGNRPAGPSCRSPGAGGR